MRVLLFLLFSTIIWIIFVYYEFDRLIKLYTSNIESLIKEYAKLPGCLSRTVILIKLGIEPLNKLTIKSLLDQSRRADNIAIETNYPDNLYFKDETGFITTHKPDTIQFREMDRKTLIITVENGNILPYDFVEKNITP